MTQGSERLKKLRKLKRAFKFPFIYGNVIVFHQFFFFILVFNLILFYQLLLSLNETKYAPYFCGLPQ